MVKEKEVVSSLVTSIHSRTGAHPSMMYLLFDGKQLNMSKDLIDHGVIKDSTIYLIAGLSGGDQGKEAS